jgi:Flp pilus assembly protein TadG
MRFSDQILGEESGASLVEVALVLPVVFLMTFGLINFALIAFGLGNLGYANRSALRYASIHSNTSLVPATSTSIANVVKPFIFPYPSNTYSTTVTYSPGNAVGSQVRVLTIVTYTVILPGFILHGPVLTSQSSGIITQ